MPDANARLERANEALAVTERLVAAGVKPNALPVFAYGGGRVKVATLTPAQLTRLLDQLDIPHDRQGPEPQVSWKTPR